MSDPTNPLIVQGDLSVLAEVSSPRFDEARAKLARFAELEKGPPSTSTPIGSRRCRCGTRRCPG
jgi:hypothetical protein